MHRINWGKILVDVGVFATIVGLIATFLLMAGIRSIAYLNFMLGCGIVLFIVLIIYVSDCIRMKLTSSEKNASNNKHNHNEYSSSKIVHSIIDTDVVHKTNVAQNKNCTNDSSPHAFVRSLLAKIKRRYSTLILIVALCYSFTKGFWGEL